jgi:hypothetical protein
MDLIDVAIDIHSGNIVSVAASSFTFYSEG